MPGDGPLTSVSATTGSLPSWASLSYNPTSGVVTISGTPNSAAATSFTLTASNRYGSAAQALSITITGTVSTFLNHFDSPTGAFADSSSNNYALTSNGVTQWAQFSKLGTGCAKFTSSSVYAQNNAAFRFSGNFTIEGFFFQFNTVNNQAIFSTDSSINSDSSNAFSFRVLSGNTINIYGNGGSLNLSSNTTHSLNTWNHFAIVRNSGTLYLYLNGNVVGSVANSTNFSNGQCYIGAGAGNYAGYYFNGYFDEFRVSNIARTISVPTSEYTADTNTVLLLHFNQNILDSSNSPITLTNNNVELTAAPKFGTACAKFNGSSYLSCGSSQPGLMLTGAFTVECWLFITSQSSNGIFIFGTSGAGGNEFYLATGTSGQAIVNGGAFVAITSANNVILLNTWNHLAVTRNASNLITLWVNGTNVGTVSTSASFNTGTLYIGWDGSNYNNWTNGYIDCFRVVNNSAIYTSGFTPSASALTAITGTTLLVQFDSLNNDVASNIPLTYYGNRYSAYFNGSNAYLSGLTNNSVLQIGVSDFTFEAWVYNQNTPQVQNSYWFGGAGNNDGLGIAIIQSNNYASVAIGTYGYLTTTTVVPQNQWTHYAVTRHSGTVTIWINGTSANTLSYPGSLNFTSQNMIGARNDLASPCYWRGYISELRISKGIARYTSNFTPPTTMFATDAYTAVLLHFWNNATDSSLNNLSITNNNTSFSTNNCPALSGPPKLDSVMSGYFNSSYITGPSNNAAFKFSGAFTIETWIYPTSQNQMAFDTSNGSNWNSLALYLENTNPPSFGVRTGSGNNTSILESGSTKMSLNTWHHFVVCRSGTTMSMYLDGNLVVSATNSQNFSDGCLNIGRQNTAQYYFSGYMSEFRISNISRYSGSTYTVPTTLFVPDTNTTCLVHFRNNVSDYSTNGLVMTNSSVTFNNNIVPALTDPNTAFGNASAYFDGATSYIKGMIGPWTQFSGNFTIDGWFNLLKMGAPSYFIFTTSTANNTSSISVGITNSWPNVTLQLYYNGSWAITSSSVIVPGIWYHFAVTRNGNTVTLYQNGIAIGSTTISNNLSDGNLVIGNSYGYANTFPGFIDEVRILNGTAAWNSNFIPPIAPYSY